MTDLRRVLTASAMAFSYGAGIAILFFIIGGSSEMLPISALIIFSLPCLQSVVAAFRQRLMLGILAFFAFCGVGAALYSSITHLQAALTERDITGGYVLKWVT